MKVGTAGTTVPPVESLLRNARRAEEKGYDSIWWPDHLMGWHPEQAWTPDVAPVASFMPTPHAFLDPVAAMAAVAVHTERVVLGTAVTEPIRRHPAVLAQEFLTLDHLTRGRVILGIGAGERENIEPYGLDFSRPVSKLEEALRIIRLLWEHDEPVSFQGEFWELRDAVCGLAPYRQEGPEGAGERRHPPIWVAAHGPRMLDLAGRQGDGWLPTYLGPERWREGWAAVREAAVRGGRDPSAVVPGLWAMLVVDEDEEEVERLLSTPLIRGWMLVLPSSAYQELGHRHPLGEDFHGLLDYVPTRLSREEALAAFAAVPVEVCRRYTINGTPDRVVDHLRVLGEAGLQHLILWNVTFMADVAKLRSSFALQDEITRALQAS